MSVCVCVATESKKDTHSRVFPIYENLLLRAKKKKKKRRETKKKSKSILAVRDTRFTTYSNAHTNTQTLCSGQLTGVRKGRSFYTEYKYTMSEQAEVLVFPLL